MKRKIFAEPAHRYSNLAWDVVFMMAGMLMAFILCIGIFEWMRGAGVLDSGGTDLRPAAEEMEQDLAVYSASTEEKAATAGEVESFGVAGAELTSENNSYGFAYAGDENARLMTFSIRPKDYVKLKRLVIGFDGYATPSDLESLQLYLEGKFIADAPFYQAKGEFRNLNLDLAAGNNKFEIKGKIGAAAESGNRIKIGILSSDDVLLQDIESRKIDVTADWPLWGGYLSVIGEKINKPVSDI